MMSEFVTIDPNIFYCDCGPDCLEKFKLPTLAGEMLKTDTALILLIGKHTSDRAGDVIKKGKGWKVHRVK